MQWSDRQSKSWLDNEAIELEFADKSVKDFVSLLEHGCEEAVRKMRFIKWLWEQQDK